MYTNLQIFLFISVFCFVLLSTSSFSSSSSIKDDFVVGTCNSSTQCNEVCFKGGELESRCDSNGVCICDCHDDASINASYTSACEGAQPEGDSKSVCRNYCVSEYQRPFRFCKDSQGSVFCTAVCDHNSKGYFEDYFPNSKLKEHHHIFK